MRRFRPTLPATILSALSLVLIVTWVLLGVVALKITERTLYSRKAGEARRLATLLTGLLPDDIAATGTSRSVHGFLETLAQDRQFRALVITDAAGNVIFAVPPAPGQDRLLATTRQKRQPQVTISDRCDTITRYAPVFSGDGSLRGGIRLTLTLAEENELLGRFRKLFLAYFALDFLLLLGVGSLLLSRLLVVPVRRLVTATGHIVAGDFAHRVPEAGTVETADLARSFNSMVESLDRQRSEIAGQLLSLEAANRELQRAREETIRSEKMASTGLLAAGMAHEVGSPLAAIMGYAGILRQELHDDPERMAYAARIEQDARRIDHIVRHLLDYARPRTVRYSRTSPGEVIRGAWELLTAQGLFKKIDVRLEIPEGLPEVSVDGEQFQQVLINLMINARDAMAGGGELRISATHETLPAPGPAGDQGATPRERESLPPPCLKVEIRDTGDGIPPENMHKIFDPFFTTKEPGRGTGLGLAICARIIDSFNGSITVESRVGSGSVFTIRLPAAGE